LSIEGYGLDAEILESKRKGFFEFTGVLRGHSENGSKFSFVSHKDSDAPIVIHILGKDSQYLIVESQSTILQAHKASEWKLEEMSFEFPPSKSIDPTCRDSNT